MIEEPSVGATLGAADGADDARVEERSNRPGTGERTKSDCSHCLNDDRCLHWGKERYCCIHCGEGQDDPGDDHPHLD